MEPDLTISRDLVAALARRDDFTMEPLPGGANNRVFRVRFPEKSALLKAYFQHPGDKRDRLGAEFSFSKFAWDVGLRCLPEPLACDRQNHLGLYEFIEGEPVREATKDAVQQALTFFHDLNRYRASAKNLPAASEACFSVAEHLTTVERRVTALNGVEDVAAATFVRDELLPCWREIVGKIPADTTPVERCVSPSDFGFHNALREASGRLRFIDFEYAGWDDSAKMICDFFCQPAVPASRKFLPMFEPPERAVALLPVYRVKWCCIMLNDFLPVGSKRRQYAGRGDRGRQLEKARQALQMLKEELK
jgi:hypothetical protein